MTELEERRKRTRKAVIWLNTTLPLGYGKKWTKNDSQAKSLARIIKL